MIYLMSTTVIPSGAWGTWAVEKVELADVALAIFPEGGKPWTSAVGHESTAQFMSQLLGQEIPANRITVNPEPGDVFFCFKLNSRPPEGAILSREQLENLGFEWAKMTYVG